MLEKSILITGCSSGIGLAAAKILKKRGYRVFASARKPADVEQLQQAGFESVLLDMNNPASIQTALDYILNKTGGTLDAIFNNAGYMQAGALEDMTDELDRRQFETNFFGPINLTRAVLPIMRQQGQGRVIQNSSILGVVSMPYYGAYNASKHALEAYTSSLRQELRNTNIHISLINPGPVISKLRDTAHTHFKAALENKTTAHFDHIYHAMKETYFKRSKNDERMAVEPEVVVKHLIHALESPHPKAHYFVGFAAKFMRIMQRILPDCVMDWLISKVR